MYRQTLPCFEQRRERGEWRRQIRPSTDRGHVGNVETYDLDTFFKFLLQGPPLFVRCLQLRVQRNTPFFNLRGFLHEHLALLCHLRLERHIHGHIHRKKRACIVSFLALLQLRLAFDLKKDTSFSQQGLPKLPTSGSYPPPLNREKKATQIYREPRKPRHHCTGKGSLVEYRSYTNSQIVLSAKPARRRTLQAVY